MRIADSRRLTGPSLWLDRPGAILEVELRGADPAPLVARWRDELRLRLEALGWTDATLAARAHRAGVSLAFTAPPDALYAATEVNEAAWRAVARAFGGEEAGGGARGHGHGDTVEDARDDADDAASFDAEIAALAARIAAERKPALRALAVAAAARGVTLLADDKRVSLGLGTGSRSWPVEAVPESAAAVRWEEIHDIPVALVTGTNGKSTSVRLIGAIARAAGRAAGVTSTDGVTIGAEQVAAGDYSGPNGARTLLRDRRVEVAVLELARGGLLRRGLAVPRARAALVTNVANDHLGEFGIFDVDALADAKLGVARAIGSDGRVVLNADDPRLLERGLRLPAPVTWFTLDFDHAEVERHVRAGGDACRLEGDDLVLLRGRRGQTVARVADVPIAFGGRALYNVANALGAIGVAAALGLPVAAMREGLASFGGGPDENPGRGNVWHLGGALAIVDFAHNPHGLEALARMAAALPARRRAIVIGQAGDRDDDAIREFARSAWAMRPDAVFVKEMDHYLRGRPKGEVPALLAAELIRAGAPSAIVEHCDSELAAVRAALEWARAGDVLVLTTHESRERVIGLMQALERARWTPGTPVPAGALETA